MKEERTKMESNSSKFLFIMITLAFSLKIPVPAGVSATDREKMQIKIGACDWTLGKAGDAAAFDLAAKLGLDGIQASLNPLENSLALLRPENQKSYLDASARTGVEIASFAIGELNNVPLKSDQRAERWVAEGIEIAAAMKVRIILVPFFGKGDLRNDPGGMKNAAAALRRLAPQAEKAGVVLALESWLSAEDHLEIIEKVGSPAVQVYYDVGNSQEAGYDILEEIRLLGKHICQFHAKDYKDLYGKGSMDFPAVREAMADIGYGGWLVIEGTQLPLGIEQSISYDLNYLRSLFPPGPT
jgi:L-ribulose-5-phosphate 3-epimerase